MFPEVLAVTRKFTDEQFGALMRAAFSYRLNGEMYSGDDVAVDVAFQIVANQIDRYQEYCDTLANNARGSKGEQKSAKQQQNTPPIHSVSSPYPIQSNPSESKADEPPARHHFSPPAVEDVRQYCSEKGYQIDAECFVSYYESIGWRVGRNEMKSWQAACRNWATREQDKPAGKNNRESGIDKLARLYKEEFDE